MLGKFDLIWKCPADSLDINESQSFAVFIEKHRKVLEGSYLLVNLEGVRFVTLLGIVSLASVVSRAISYGFTITISLPNNEPAKIFIHYFGFVDTLAIPRQMGAVAIPDKISLKKPRNGKRVFSSKPIYCYHDADQFVNFSNIREWINQLDSNTKDCDFFKSGRFARLVSAELGLNIVTHAELPTSVQEGRESFGVIAMRVIDRLQGEDDRWVHRSFKAHKGFIQKHLDTGFVEVCICDPGQGMRSALEATYKARMIEKYGAEAIADDPVSLTRDIIEFAFDEFGTSKTGDAQWITDAHALSRILRLVNAYGGILEVTTGNLRVVYRLNDSELKKNSRKLGYKSSEAAKCECPFGTNIRILVPLSRVAGVPYPAKIVSISSGDTEYSIVPVATEYDQKDLEDARAFRKTTDLIGTFMAGVSNPNMLVLDFSNCDSWRSDHFATLLDRLYNVITGRLAVIIGINPALAHEIVSRCYESAERTDLFYKGDGGAEEHDAIHYLSCLTDLHQVLLAIDTEGTIHWIGSTHPTISHICSKLLEGPLTDADIASMVPLYAAKVLNVGSVLHNTDSLFIGQKHAQGIAQWVSKVGISQLELLRGKVLVEHLERHLQDVSEALWGRDGTSAFLLPHSKKYVSTFIEATRILQEEEFCREVGEVLARLVWVGLQKCEPTVIIATTAPSLLLANAVRRHFKNLPLIVDIGHYFDSPKKVVLQSLSIGETNPRIIIVQDIVHSGKTLNEICEALEAAGNSVGAVVTLIECSDEVSSISSGGIGKVYINGEDKTLISLYKYPMPKQLVQKEIKLLKAENIYWVEPYSLHPFKFHELKRAHYQYLRGDTPTVASGSHIEKLLELEEHDVLRFGHFVYENHHFSLVTRMLKFFETSSLADKVVDEIVSIADAVSGELTFLFPLHSHIRYLVPRILDRLSSRSIRPSFYFPVVARELGQRPYYMSPFRLERLLSQKYEARLKGETTSKLNIVIVDDTTATLRTFETILRSVYLAAVRPAGKIKTIDASDVINKVDVWAVINRTGRAKSTFLHSVKNWLGVPFTFHCYAEYDIAVYDDNSCPVCQEYRHLSHAYKLLDHGSTTSLKNWVNAQLNQLRPVIVDSPSFDNLPPANFPGAITFTFGTYRARSMPLACLIFLEVAERGCPARYLINALNDFTQTAIHHLDDVAVAYFREFVFSWLIMNWRKVASDASPDEYFRFLDTELTIRPKSALKLLLTCSMCKEALPVKVFDEIVRKVIRTLASLSARAKRVPTIENMEAREIIFNSIVLFKAALVVNNPDRGFLQSNLAKFFEDLPDEPVTPGDFQGSIKDVVNAALTFLPTDSVPVLECLKLASMELLIPPRRASGAARVHCNRIYKHLRELVSPDANEEYVEVLTKVKGSVGFLDVRSKFLCEAISNLICGRVAEPAIINAELREVQDLFQCLSGHIREISISGLRTDEIVRSRSFRSAQECAIALQAKLFTKTCTIYKEIYAYNVKYWQILNEVNNLAKKRKVSNRLKLPYNEVDDSHTVFADDFELKNFLINHTVDVLEKHPEIRISVSLSEYCSGETLLISITSFSAEGNARKNIYEGHGFRFERWGLKRFGADIHLIENSPDTEVTIQCQLFHGYV